MNFESSERQEEEINGVMTKIPWKCTYRDYKKTNGVLIPGRIQAIKVYKDKELVYFDSDNFEIKYYK